jgi:hypothetical protein
VDEASHPLRIHGKSKITIALWNQEVSEKPEKYCNKEIRAKLTFFLSVKNQPII